MTKSKNIQTAVLAHAYDRLRGVISGLVDEARRYSARSVNAILTATYWLIGWRIVEYEQEGKKRAEYGERLLHRSSNDLTRRYGKGFSADNLETMRLFYLANPRKNISETVSRKSVSINSETVSRISAVDRLSREFPLSWSHDVLLVRRVESPEARTFYEREALRGGWSVRQLDRQRNASKLLERKARR